MKTLKRDIVFTLLLKFLLLFVLWWVCIRGHHPVIQSGQNWLFGTETAAVRSELTSIEVQ